MDILTEIIVDLVVELHSILRTRLPYQWDFIKINQNKGLTIVLNNFTYFTVYLAFLVWFVKTFISSVQDTTGRRLETKDKCLAAVVSMVSAMHLLWPFLLFTTYFLTCEFYPWTTAVLVCLLNIIPFATSQNKFCLNISSKISDNKDYIKRLVSFRTTDESGTDHESSEEDSISSTEGRNVRKNETPFIHPGLLVNNKNRPSERSEVEPLMSPDDLPGPSQTPTIQPKFTNGDPYRLSDRPRIESQLIPDDQLKQSETPIIQPGLTGEDAYRPSDRPRIQPRGAHKNTHGSSKTPGIQPRSTTTPNRPTKDSKMQPRALAFESESEKTGISDDSEDSASETLRGISEKTPIHQRTRDEKYGQKSDFWKFEYEVVDDLIPYEDFKEQMHLNKTRVKTSTPKKYSGNELMEDTAWSTRLQSEHKGLGKVHYKSYCGRCWKMVNQSFNNEFRTLFEPHTTRLGTIYGPPNIFCQCTFSQINIER